MLSRLKELLAFRDSTATDGADSEAKQVEIATAALMVVTLRADFEVHEAETREVFESLRKGLRLNDEQTASLFELANGAVDESVSLHDFTSVLNSELDYERKVGVIEAMWRIALADKVLERHEEYIVRKVASLLYVDHKDFIAAKLRARKEE
jgi:uncharacterized tellurite resistance protein B-like protein